MRFIGGGRECVLIDLFKFNKEKCEGGGKNAVLTQLLCKRLGLVSPVGHAKFLYAHVVLLHKGFALIFVQIQQANLCTRSSACQELGHAKATSSIDRKRHLFFPPCL